MLYPFNMDYSKKVVFHGAESEFRSSDVEGMHVVYFEREDELGSGVSTSLERYEPGSRLIIGAQLQEFILKGNIWHSVSLQQS